MTRFDLDWIGNHYWPPRWWRRSVAWLGFWGCGALVILPWLILVGLLASRG